MYREASDVVERMERLEFPAMRSAVPSLRAAIAWTRGDHDVIERMRAALDGSIECGTVAYVLLLRRRLGKAIGGDEGAALVKHGDADARACGITNPERAAELVIPTGRFS